MANRENAKKSTPICQTSKSLGALKHTLRPKIFNKIAGVLLIIFVGVAGLFL